MNLKRYLQYRDALKRRRNRKLYFDLQNLFEKYEAYIKYMEELRDRMFEEVYGKLDEEE